MTVACPQTSSRSGAGAVAVALVLVVLVAAPADARPVAPSPRTAEEYGAVALLVRAAHASGRIPYHGVRFISAWTRTGPTTMLVEVDHRPGRGTVVRPLGAAPERKRVMYEPHAAATGQGFAGVTLNLLARHYELALAGLQDVAGRRAYVVEARREDGSVAARFWLDRSTGLVLRRMTHGHRGKVVRTSAFIQLEVGSSAEPIADPPDKPERWQQRLRPGQLDELRAGGWTIPQHLPGGLSLIDARRGVVDGSSVVHLSYSDGLAMVSLFVQRGTLAERSLKGWRRTKAGGCCVVYRQHTIPRRAVWAGEDRVYTVVADAPPGVVRRVVAALPHQDRERGMWGRMARGFAQLGTWLNPFG